VPSGVEQIDDHSRAVHETGAGFSQNLYAAYLDISAGTVVGGWNAFGAFVCVVCGTMAIVYGIAYSAVRSDMKALLAKIKGRKLGRVPTSTGAA
jgi:hypothetical protein